MAEARKDDDGKGIRTLSVETKNPYRWYVITRGWDHDRARYIKKVPKQTWIDEADVATAPGKHLYKTQQLMDEQPDAWHHETYGLRPGYKVHAWWRKPLWVAYVERGGREHSPWPRDPAAEIPEPDPPKAVKDRRRR